MVQETKKFLKEGDKVKLNVKNIKNHPDYLRVVDKYKDWIDAHCNEVFTIEFDKKYQNNSSLLCFREDTTIPKWLFWEGDLDVIEN